MTKYIAKETFYDGVIIQPPERIVDIKKLAKPVVLGGRKFYYSIPSEDRYLTKGYLRKNFVKIRKSNTLIRNLLIIGAWELGKYLGEQLVILSTKNDEVDMPSDFNENDHAHLNELTGGIK